MGTKKLILVPMGTKVPKWGPMWEQCLGRYLMSLTIIFAVLLFVCTYVSTLGKRVQTHFKNFNHVYLVCHNELESQDRSMFLHF